MTKTPLENEVENLKLKLVRKARVAPMCGPAVVVSRAAR
jgi:hypothetical protein